MRGNGNGFQGFPMPDAEYESAATFERNFHGRPSRLAGALPDRGLWR